MQFRNTRQNYGTIAILLHWLVAVGIVGLFVLGLWMVDLTYYDNWYQTAPDLHKSIGVLLFFVVLFRAGWRLFNLSPAALPSHSKSERFLARLVHRTLYLLLFAVMLTGYLIATADGRAVTVFGWFEIPATLNGIDNQEDIAGEIHFVLAVTLLSLAGLHALAAFKHHFIDRDSTLRRMLSSRDTEA